MSVGFQHFLRNLNLPVEADSISLPPPESMTHRVRKLFHLGVLFLALPLLAQSNSGELRLKVIGPDGFPLQASVELSSDALQFRRSFSTDESGQLTARNLLFGLYRLQVRSESFSAYDGIIEIHSTLPTDYLVQLNIAALSTAVNVTAENTLLDPERTGTINHLDSKAIADRPASLPGLPLESPIWLTPQPGWLYTKGMPFLHPRGSESSNPVCNGSTESPLTRQPIPQFSTLQIEADDVDSLTIYTAGIPAECWAQDGWSRHRRSQRSVTYTRACTVRLFLSGGELRYGQEPSPSVQDTWGRNTLGGSASGNATARYLNPVVPENYSNRGTTARLLVKLRSRRHCEMIA